MGSGGWFGMGLGASREKWVGLPEAHTDFIYAVVGEELGLFGSLLVIGLFTTIVIAGLRMARRTSDPFVRTASAAAVAWIFTQAFLNLGAVLQLIPITGVPLPLVSYGGSSLVPTLFVLGMLMSFARAEAGRTPVGRPTRAR
jgi:cell division protein FtsW